MEAATAGVVGCAVVVFSLRRLIFLLAALSRGREYPSIPAGTGRSAGFEVPSVALLVPARNEGRGAERALRAIEKLDYPLEALRVVAIDDGSDDDTRSTLERAGRRLPGFRVVTLARSRGKAAALNAGLAAAPGTELVAICDADLVPRPDWLSWLVRGVADPKVGACAGLIAPRNPGTGVVSAYAALESWVYQRVTSAGKDRLGLNPCLNGSSCYRRVALEEIGGFGGGAPGEDVRTTWLLTRVGWRTRFMTQAVAENDVATDLRDYWSQHVRWSRNLLSSARALPGRAAAAADRTVLRRIEGRVASTGYLDRIALIGAVGFAAAGTVTPWLAVAYCTVAALEVVVAVSRAGEGWHLGRYLAALPIMFPVDAGASIASILSHLRFRPRGWPGTPRAQRI